MEFLSTLHPKIVHFPIALFVVYALMEIIGSFVKKDFFLQDSTFNFISWGGWSNSSCFDWKLS